ncbi:ParB/RepB/Spo0J family partition protein [Streptomyces sp. NPDC017943]|uniref:ParB/RepB/Spo0J family partition protein n=1 Tax=Streptomyces sp. NPDC017943 TaxID=3365019 RepID=UPI00378FF501
MRPDQLMPSPENGRKKLFKIDELAETLRTDGMNTAVTVIPPDVYVDFYPQHKEEVEARVADGALFVVHHGHRRLAAALLAGLKEVPILVRREVPSLRIAAIQENLQRMALSPLEEALEFQEALEEKDETGQQLTQRELAKRVGCSQTYVSHRIALLRLIPDLQQATVNHWLKEQGLIDSTDAVDGGHAGRLLLPVREAAVVLARLRPDMQEAFARGELNAAQAAMVAKIPLAEQELPSEQAVDDGAEVTDTSESNDGPAVPEPRGSDLTDAAAAAVVEGVAAPAPAPSSAVPGPATETVPAAASPESSGTLSTAVATAPEPRGVIVVRSVEELALQIREYLNGAELQELKRLLED